MSRKKEEISSSQRNSIYRRLLKETGRIRLGLIVMCVLSAFAMTANLIAPKLLSDVLEKLNDFTLHGEPIGGLLAAISNALILLLAVYVAYSVAYYFKMLASNKIVSRHFTAGLRIDMSTKIKYLPVSFVDKTETGQILDRMTNDVSVMGNTVHNIVETLMMGVLQILAITAIMFTINWALALVVIVFVPLNVALSAVFAKKTENHYDAMYKNSGEIYSVVEETYGGFQTIKSYNLEQKQQLKYKEYNVKLQKAQEKATFISSVVSPIVSFTNNISYVVICLLGAYFAIGGVGIGGRAVGLSAIVSIVLYSKMFASPLEQIAGTIGSMQRVASAAKRVYEVLDEKEMEVQTVGVQKPVKGVVDFENVAFSYTGGKPVINDLNVHVDAGKKIAIVGPTGAGKTTIVNLLMRFYDVDSGAIKVDGQDIEKLSRESVRECFSMVLQDTWLFSGTIYDNIAYGRENVTREDVENAAKAAYADGFIRMLPDGYDTVIDENVSNISGGQKQLLTIARAFLSDRPMLILDEATSSVDTRTELLIQNAMDKLMKDRTSFVIAHRLSTIVNADLILVINNGDIVETGTHGDLLEKGGFYAKLYNSQYGIVC